MPPRWGSEIETEINLLQIYRSYGAFKEYFISIEQVEIFRIQPVTGTGISTKNSAHPCIQKSVNW